MSSGFPGYVQKKKKKRLTSIIKSSKSRYVGLGPPRNGQNWMCKKFTGEINTYEGVKRGSWKWWEETSERNAGLTPVKREREEGKLGRKSLRPQSSSKKDPARWMKSRWSQSHHWRSPASHSQQHYPRDSGNGPPKLWTQHKCNSRPRGPAAGAVIQPCSQSRGLELHIAVTTTQGYLGRQRNVWFIMWYSTTQCLLD